MGVTTEIMAVHIPPKMEAAYNMYTLLASTVITQDRAKGMAMTHNTFFLPQLTDIPAGREPKKAPNKDRDATQDPWSFEMAKWCPCADKAAIDASAGDE